MNRVSELRKIADQLSAGNREPQTFRGKLIMTLYKHPPSEQHVILARIFENISHFSQAEQLDLTRVPEGVLNFVNGKV